MQRCLLMLSLALTFGLGASSLVVASQFADGRLERAYLSDRVTSELEGIREDARSSFAPLMDYPEDIRHAIWELCTDPQLIVLMDNSNGGRAGYERLLAGRSDSVRRAARTLMEYPSVVSLLAENVGMSAILGRVYAREPVEMRRLLDVLAGTASTSRGLVDTDWEQRMRDNSTARRELERAHASWAASQATTGINVTLNVVVPPGGFVVRRGVVVIYRPPARAFALWVLDRSALYPWLWAELWHHHHHHHRWYTQRWRHQRWDWNAVSRQAERRLDRQHDRRQDRREDRRDDRKDDRRDDRRDDRKDDRKDDRRDDRKDDRRDDRKDDRKDARKDDRSRDRRDDRAVDRRDGGVRRGTLNHKEQTRDAQIRHREAWSGRASGSGAARGGSSRSSSNKRSGTPARSPASERGKSRRR